MLAFHGKKAGGELSRRDFLRAGSLGATGLALAELQRASAGAAKGTRCILLFLVGAPSQLDTFDLKPAAPSNVRGPFRPVATRAPGVEVCEHLPRLAKIADRVALVRSVHHDAAPIHETGHQLMQTGHLFTEGREYPHYGAVLSQRRGGVEGAPPFVVLPQTIGNTGVSVSHGQGAGPLGPCHEPFVFEADPMSLKQPRDLARALDEAARVWEEPRRDPREKKAGRP